MCSLLWFPKQGAEEVHATPYYDGRAKERASWQHRFESREASVVHHVFTWEKRIMLLMAARSLTHLKALVSGSSKASEPMPVDGGQF